MKIDYLKQYDNLISRLGVLPLGERTPNFNAPINEHALKYVERLLKWLEPSVFPYSFTLSPKSSPLLKGKALGSQYSYLVNYLKNTLQLYTNKYFITFEIYLDNINLHCHGFLTFRTLDNVTHLKRLLKKDFNIKLEPRQKDPLSHIKLIGNDDDQRKRWVGYCFKEMEYMIKNDYFPIYRWDDEYIIPIKSTKSQKKKKLISLETLPLRLTKDCNKCNNCSICKPPMFSNYELESEEEEEEPVEIDEYLLYLKLKSKFKNLEKNI